MRSRPDLFVYLRPGDPTPGSRLEAEVVLHSRSDTPIDGIEAHLAGVEQRLAVRSPGATEDRGLVDLVARTPKAMLSRGEHRFKFAFDIPRHAPPRYASRTARVAYDLHVRVSIPWWPDREGRFVVPLVAAPEARTGAPGIYCTHANGPQGDALYMEASLDAAAIPVGGVIRGAVSAVNAARHRVRRIELALVQLEHAPDAPGESVGEGHRYLVRLHEGAPADGRSIPFQVRLPEDAATTFRGSLFEVRWYVEIRAVVALGSDVTLGMPIHVFRAAEGAPKESASLARVPPVGKRRRAVLWAECARKNGFENDAENERMSAAVGDASLAVTLEPRKAGGLALTAQITWPRLGVDLAVTERRWIDTWSNGVCEIAVPGFADRFTTRGREAAQVKALLDPNLCACLARFDEAAVGDEGATLVSAGTGQSLEELDAFVGLALSTARALSAAVDRVPAPASMASMVPAWRAAAASLGGKLGVGDMSIHEAAFDESSLSIVTEWAADGTPAATVVRFPIARRDDGGEPRPLDGQGRAIVASLEPQVTSLDVGAHAIEARLPAPVADPRALEPVLAGLGTLARLAAGGAVRGPYR